MVQVLPTGRARRMTLLSFFPRAARKRIKTGSERHSLCRLDLKYPPTPVGGISEFFTSSAVGGISYDAPGRGV